MKLHHIVLMSTVPQLLICGLALIYGFIFAHLYPTFNSQPTTTQSLAASTP